LEIIVEIGTLEEQEQIREELMLFSLIVSRSNSLVNISKVIVPRNFDAKVNELQGTLDYKSNRGIVALARNINLGDSDAIVLSHHLYTSAYCDAQVRLYLSFHEMAHTVNRKMFPQLSDNSGSEGIYLENLYTLFDEYIADRFALALFDDVISAKTTRWNNFISDFALGFSSIINNSEYYTKIKNEIDAFRQHGDSGVFLRKIHDDFHSVAISISHAFAISDHDSQILSSAGLLQSHFVNEKTLALMNFLKDKYQEQVYDINDGFELIVEFMTNFGMKFKNIPEGTWCQVLDI
jgi:hypothetical protein